MGYEIRLLGRFELRDNDELLVIHSRQAQSLLAYLAINAGIGHRREKLAGMLWPAISEADARRNLRWVLWQIRKEFPEQSFLRSDDIQISISIDPQVLIDVQVFKQKLPVNWSVESLIQILSVYEGELLPGFYDDWVILEREHLRTIFETRLNLLLDRLVLTQSWRDVLDWGERGLKQLGPSEPVFRAMMRAYAGVGDLGGVSQVFHRCYETLLQELGVEPSEETLKLFHQLTEWEHPLIDRKFHPSTGSAFAHQVWSLIPPVAAVEQVAPYRGLQHYDEGDATLFFGREKIIAKLLKRLGISDDEISPRDNFLAILGASGSGKSSLVRAGLVPAIRRVVNILQTRDQSDWAGTEVCLLTPGPYPLENLATKLTQSVESVTAAVTLLDDMRKDSRSLRLFLDKHQIRLFLVVDQFEEIFLLCHSEIDCRCFIDNLLTALDCDRIKVVLTLRADYYSHLTPYENLRQVITGAQEYIGPMNASEQRRAIESPAQQTGYDFEPGLVDVIMHDLGMEPGALPLLSQALLETWKRRKGNLLTLAGYAEAGGIHHAIARSAEQVYTNLDPDQQLLARTIFVRLTWLGDGVPDTCRRVEYDDLVSLLGKRQALEQVLNILAEARLVTISENEVVVAHEALIREWPTLRSWLAEDREGLHNYNRLSEAAREWDDLEKDPGELYRGIRLAQSLEWAEMHPGELPHLEEEFLAASKNLQELEIRRQEAANQQVIRAAQELALAECHRAEQQAAAASRLRWISAGLFGLLLLVLVLGGLVVRESRLRKVQANLAISREFAASAISNNQLDPQRGLLQALQALRTSYTLEAENALHQSLQAQRLVRLFPAKNHRISRVVACPLGLIAASSLDDEENYLTEAWDKNTGERLFQVQGVLASNNWPVSDRLAVLQVDQQGRTKLISWDFNTKQITEVTHLEFDFKLYETSDLSPDFRLLAMTLADGTTQVFNRQSGKRLLSIGKSGDLPGRLIAFSRDSKYLLTNLDRETQLWDLESSRKILTLVSSPYGAAAGSFNPRDFTLAVAVDSGVEILDWKTGKSLDLLNGIKGATRSVEYSLDGEIVAGGGNDSQVILWDASSGKELRKLSGHAGGVNDLAFIPFRRQLITGGNDGLVRLWDLTPEGNHEGFAFSQFGRLTSVAFNEDGRQLAVSGVGQPDNIYDIATGVRLITLPANQSGYQTGSIAFSTDGSFFATASGGYEADVFDLASLEKILTLTGHTREIGDLSYNPAGIQLATLGYDGLLKTWDAKTGLELRSMQAFSETVQVFQPIGLTYSPNGRLVATAGGPKVKIWDVVDGSLRLEIPSRVGQATSVAFNPGGDRLVVGTFSGVVSIVDVNSGRVLTSWIGHQGPIQSIYFCQAGQQIITGSQDGTVKIWDAQSGEERLTLVSQSSPITGLALSPDESRLAVIGEDGSMHIYLLKIDELIAQAKQRVSGWVPSGECQKYLPSDYCQFMP